MSASDDGLTARLRCGTPFVVFGDDWSRNVSTLQHLFRHIAMRHPVIWINAIGHRVPALNLNDGRRAVQKAAAMLVGRDRHRRLGDTGIGAEPQCIINPMVLPWHDRSPVHRFNTWSLVRAIRRSLRDANAHPPPVLVTGSPPSAGVVGRLAERAAIYFCMDDFLHLPTTSPAMLRSLESRLLASVDCVVATARNLTLQKRPATGKAYYLPQGVNYQHFSTPRTPPADMVGLSRPIVGFAGAFYDRCDVELLRRVADANPGGSLVLVGPILRNVGPLQRPNVHILGPRPYRDLPSYVQCFDVGIIPYVLNEETVAVDPLKLLEYLAAGIPVVCTGLPEAEKYRDVVRIAREGDAFVHAVLELTHIRSATEVARRQATAKANDWSQRAERFLEICGEVIIARGREHPAP